jgi:hypothetical protein
MNDRKLVGHMALTGKETSLYTNIIGRDVTVGNGGNLKLKAKHQILINENFVVQAGGLFEMYAHQDIPNTCP